MKNKPKKHKEGNTFRFKPFAERVSGIDIDVFHRVGHANEEESEEGSCHFHLCLQKWSLLNLTQTFGAFQKETRGIVTLPQLLLRKEQVFNSLISHIQKKDPNSLQALLELTVALARDLQKDFYDHYFDIHEAILQLLNTKDAEQLEWCFTCLAYIYKILWRFFAKDIDNVFLYLAPLLSSSYPVYINNFAAESFAFVGRKVKDTKSFLRLILKAVKFQEDGVSGCGRFLFEIMRGVQGSFHSCADSLLPFLFRSLYDPVIPLETLTEVLESTVENIAANISPDKSRIFWTSGIETARELLKNPKETHKSLESLLLLLGQAVERRDGKLLHEPSPLVDLLEEIATATSIADLHKTRMRLVTLLMLSENIKLTDEQCRTLVQTTITKSNCVVFLAFVSIVHSHSCFETLILPHLIKLCLKTEVDSVPLCVLAKVITTKSPLCGSGIRFKQWQKYPIDFGGESQNMKIADILFSYTVYEDVEKLRIDPELLLCSLICLPHINGLNIKILSGCLDKMMELVCSYITQNSLSVENKRTLLFILNNLLECRLHTRGTDHFDMAETIVEFLLPLATEPKYLSSLHSLDLLLVAYEGQRQMICEKMLELLHKHLQVNFSSPFHEVRLLTAHIHSLFENLPIFQCSTEVTAKFEIFSLCYTVENTPLSALEYREQTQKLQKMSCDKQQWMLCCNTPYRSIPLRYCLGALYINLKLLWTPIIEAMANCLLMEADHDEFWSIFVEIFKNVDEIGRQLINVSACESGSQLYHVKEIFVNLYSITNKPDYVKYKGLLLSAMLEFPDLIEEKRTDFIDMFYEFLKKNGERGSLKSAFMCNIKLAGRDERKNEQMEIVGSDDEENLTAPSKSDFKRYLAGFLKVLAKIKNPRSLPGQNELTALLYDYLGNRDENVQKAALDCILNYNHKYINPYKEHLYALMDNAKLKHELTVFKIDAESGMVLKEHRSGFIPIFMRILFSKMNLKNKESNRLKLILRYLSSCQEEELMCYVEMVFKNFHRLVKGKNAAEIFQNASEVDLENCVSPKKLLGGLSMLKSALDQFGGMLGPKVLKYLIHILVAIGSIAYGALNQRDLLCHPKNFKYMKEVRNACVKVLTKLFDQFEHHAMTSLEIDVFFQIFVFPSLDKLENECLNSTTPLLWLFSVWGKNPKYFPLLVKHESQDRSLHALKHIVALFVNDKCSDSVYSLILEVFTSLLKLEVDETTDKMVEANNVMEIDSEALGKLQLSEKLNYGSSILLPHISAILECFTTVRTGRNLSVNETFVLTRISELVTDAKLSNSAVSLLLPIIAKKLERKKLDNVHNLLISVNNMMKHSATPLDHFDTVLPLFLHAKDPEIRKLLCQLLNTVSSKDETHAEMARLNSEMNSYSSRYLDQPDFERRIEAFNALKTIILERKGVEFRHAKLISYNCFHFLDEEKDFSLREASRSCMETLVKNLRKTKGSDLITIILLPHIYKRLDSSADDIRADYIVLLGHLARNCHNKTPVLKELKTLCIKVEEEDSDFFSNVVHLQKQKRGQALKMLCRRLQKPKIVFKASTLARILLPICSHYVCTDASLQSQSVANAATKAVIAMANHLPWFYYMQLLDHYLKKLLANEAQHLHQNIHMVVSILNAFHFDLSNALKTTETPAEVDDDKEKMEVVSEKYEKMEEAFEKDEKMEEVSEKDEEMEVVSENDEKVEEVSGKDKKHSEGLQPLSAKSAASIIEQIQTLLLPKLNKALSAYNAHDLAHKANKKNFRQDKQASEAGKVPISLALVKLLTKLPTAILEHQLPGIFFKLCTFLQSRLPSTRVLARDMMKKIIACLGTKYLGVLLNQLTSLLTRGYQLHVLVVAVYDVVNSLQRYFQKGDLDQWLLSVIEICQIDLFGQLSEEKEIAKLRRKSKEATLTKSYLTYHLCAQYITEKCLIDLILPVKKILEQTTNHKVVVKAEGCLRHIALGVIDNEFITSEALLFFAYGIASECIPELLAIGEKPKLTESEREKLMRERPDCYLIPALPVYKNGYRPKTVKISAKANSHVLISFGLRLCLLLISRGKIDFKLSMQYLDPFVSIFMQCLASKHTKLCTLSLQNLAWLLPTASPALLENRENITEKVFALLHKYASTGLSKGDNFELVEAAFKVAAVLTRDKNHPINTTQAKTLLLYAEQDLHDSSKQATAFRIVKAIMERKVDIRELHSLMKHIAVQSVQSEIEHIRQYCRSTYLKYLLNYPQRSKMTDRLTFFVRQLDYELETGRQSALKLIHDVISVFPQRTLGVQAGLLFAALGCQMINDDSEKCKKMANNCVVLLLNRVSARERKHLFELVLSWFNDRQVSLREVATLLCISFVAAEEHKFAKRLPDLKESLLMNFGLDEASSVGRFVRLPTIADALDDSNDHLRILLFRLLVKISTKCPDFTADQCLMAQLAEESQRMLRHPHEWVRLGAAEFLGCVLSKLDTEALGELLRCKKSKAAGFLFRSPAASVRSLMLDLCDQLRPQAVREEMADQTVRNLVVLARALEAVPSNADRDEGQQWFVTLASLCLKMKQIAFTEVVSGGTKHTILRTAVFNWIGALATIVQEATLKQVLQPLLRPLIREITAVGYSEVKALKELAMEVCSIIKGKIGDEVYLKAVTEVEQRLATKRLENKKARKQLVVTHPELAAKLKLRSNARKLEGQKRKMAALKGRKVKKRKVASL